MVIDTRYQLFAHFDVYVRKARHQPKLLDRLMWLRCELDEISIRCERLIEPPAEEE